MRACFWLLILAGWFVAAGITNDPAPAAEDGWIVLTGPQWGEVFQGPPAGWLLAENVTLSTDNPRRLAGKAGKAGKEILFNGKAGRAPDLITKQKFADLEVHVEFLIAKGSNSGVKFAGVYEVQIFDSFGKKELTGADCGGVYPRADVKPNYHHIDKGIPPKVNACKAPGEWQVLDAIFLAPRFDQSGKKTAKAKLVKATLNGQVIHENQELDTPTGHVWREKEPPSGPLLLQGDHGPVAFRNVRVRSVQK